MNEIIRRGRSLQKVKESVKKEYKLTDEQLNYVEEQKSSSGFLGLFGKKDAIVRFILPNNNVEDKIRQYLQTLLKYLQVSYRDIEIKRENSTFYTHIKGVDKIGFLIGKEGKMLASIQLLLNKIVDDQDRKRDNVILDIDNYLNRQKNKGQDNIPQPKPPKPKKQSKTPENGQPAPKPRRNTPYRKKKSNPTNVSGSS